MTEPPEELDEDLCAPIKKLKGLSQGAAFSEQAESLMSSCTTVEEQVATAYQLAKEWDFPVLDCVSKFYGAWAELLRQSHCLYMLAKCSQTLLGI